MSLILRSLFGKNKAWKTRNKNMLVKTNFQNENKPVQVWISRDVFSDFAAKCQTWLGQSESLKSVNPATHVNLQNTHQLVQILNLTSDCFFIAEPDRFAHVSLQGTGLQETAILAHYFINPLRASGFISQQNLLFY